MTNPVSAKTWLSPFVAIAFAIIAVTGVLLFFHVKNGSIMALHEWFGWLFVVAGAVHTVLNFRSLAAYLKRPAAWISLGAALVIAVVLAAGGARHEDNHHRRSYRDVSAPPSSSSAMP